ncbi:MAG: hypothetical protein H7A15_06455 [Sinobacteraceae bacterium]|nr:hypothetical protein [Nevskiaceae bacterium]
MTTSASTPRLRLTLLWYLLLIAAAALTQPATLPAALQVLLDASALLLVAAAVLGRIWCSVFIAGRKDTQLIVDGPYAICRHPLYVLSMLGGAGLGLATHSATLTIATLLLLCGLFRRAAIAEEALLASRHPAAFAAYAAATPRFRPRLERYRIPASIEVLPLLLWKAFIDGGAFLLLLALVFAASALRAGGAWQPWFVLP